MNASHEFGLQTREVVNHGAWAEVEEMTVCALAFSHCCQGLARIHASHRKACIIEALCLDDNRVEAAPRFRSVSICGDPDEVTAAHLKWRFAMAAEIDRAIVIALGRSDAFASISAQTLQQVFPDTCV